MSCLPNVFCFLANIVAGLKPPMEPPFTTLFSFRLAVQEFLVLRGVRINSIKMNKTLYLPALGEEGTFGGGSIGSEKEPFLPDPEIPLANTHMYTTL